jgi:hypothetical protein
MSTPTTAMSAAATRRPCPAARRRAESLYRFLYRSQPISAHLSDANHVCQAASLTMSTTGHRPPKTADFGVALANHLPIGMERLGNHFDGLSGKRR